MKTLFILRHADAIAGSDMDDHDRYLSEAGLACLPRLAKVISRQGWQVEWVGVSTALRTRQTAQEVLEAFGGPEVIHDKALYLATPGTLLAWLNRQEGNGNGLLVGHNPGLSQLVTLLSGEAAPEVSPRWRQGLPTAGLAVVELPDGPWEAVIPAIGRLVDYRVVSV